MSDTTDRVRELLERLRMRDALDALDDVLPRDKSKRLIALKSLEALLRVEKDRRRERNIARRIKESRLPDHPTLEAFDFDFQPTLDRDLVLELATLTWVDRRHDCLFVGWAGTGKSHIAKALCLIGCSQERRVLYTTCADLLTDLVASLADDTLRERLKRYTLPTILLIDDLGYDPIEQEQAREAQLLYKVFDARHGRRSTIVTSNLDVDAWADYLGSHHLTVALLDRLLYHATTITIEGPSYRLAQHEKRQQQRQKTTNPQATSADSETD